MPLFYKILIGFITGLILTLGSLTLPHRVASHEQLRRMQFGFPFWSVQQDVTLVDRFIPDFIFIQSPWENPTDLRPIAFLSSWIFFVILSLLLLEVVKGIKTASILDRSS